MAALCQLPAIQPRELNEHAGSAAFDEVANVPSNTAQQTDAFFFMEMNFLDCATGALRQWTTPFEEPASNCRAQTLVLSIEKADSHHICEEAPMGSAFLVAHFALQHLSRLNAAACGPPLVTLFGFLSRLPMRSSRRPPQRVTGRDSLRCIPQMPKLCRQAATQFAESSAKRASAQIVFPRSRHLSTERLHERDIHHGKSELPGVR